jgi:adenosylcobinamide-phosphate synthase
VTPSRRIAPSRQRARSRLLGAAAGIVIDSVLPEPPSAVHPVALFGRAMTGVEYHLYRDRRVTGVLFALTGTAVGVGAGVAVRSTTVATTMAVAGHSLLNTASGIGKALDAGDLDRARALLPSLVGRDPTGLDQKEVARAVVESVAENTVDAVVAPALWGAVAGAPGVLAHRAVNTLDSMVGHRSDRYANFGWASARLDDAMAWLPARITAVLVAVVRPGSAGRVARAVHRQAPAHPSPNSGVAEAAFAAALGLRLGGENRYGDRVELRPSLGDGRAVEPSDIHRAVRLSRDVGSGMAAGLVAAGTLPWWRTRP